MEAKPIQIHAQSENSVASPFTLYGHEHELTAFYRCDPVVAGLFAGVLLLSNMIIHSISRKYPISILKNPIWPCRDTEAGRQAGKQAGRQEEETES